MVQTSDWCHSFCRVVQDPVEARDMSACIRPVGLSHTPGNAPALVQEQLFHILLTIPGQRKSQGRQDAVGDAKPDKHTVHSGSEPNACKLHYNLQQLVVPLPSVLSYLLCMPWFICPANSSQLAGETVPHIAPIKYLHMVGTTCEHQATT